MNADVAGDVLAEIEGRAEAATPGPWVHNGVNGIHTRIGACVAISHVHEDQRRWEDATFIAAARTDVPRMAEALRAVLKALDQLRDDATYHESMESDPAEIRTRAGWKSVDDYRQDIEAAITTGLGCEAGK